MREIATSGAKRRVSPVGRIIASLDVGVLDSDHPPTQRFHDLLVFGIQLRVVGGCWYMDPFTEL